LTKLAPLLKRLHDDACERDKAGNRDLHFDQYCLLVLLYLFNPIVTSLRGIQQASALAKVQKKLGCPRVSLGSLSEAASVFDADRLKEIIVELGAELEPLARDVRLKDIDLTDAGRVAGVLSDQVARGFFKPTLGCRHLLSHNENGIEIQTYRAIIACLLIALWTGHRPTLRTYEMICFYFRGLASEEELLSHIAKLKRRDGAHSDGR